jgi:hypothetical protein
MLGKYSNYRDEWEDQQVLSDVSVDWNIVTVSTGLFHPKRDCDAVSVQPDM